MRSPQMQSRQLQHGECPSPAKRQAGLDSRKLRNLIQSRIARCSKEVRSFRRRSPPAWIALLPGHPDSQQLS
jgi:hypothetical protein